MQRQEIAALMPHQGDMMLLDRLVSRTPDEIVCLGWTPGDDAHPLREMDEDGRARIPASAALEYAAQAIALHGVLKGRGENVAPKSAFIAGLQDMRWRAAPLAAADWPIEMRARTLGGLGEAGAKYEVVVTDASGEEILRGEALVMFGGPGAS